MYKSFTDILFLFLLGKYLELQLLIHSVGECLLFLKTLRNCSSMWLFHFVFPLVMYKSFIGSYHLLIQHLIRVFLFLFHHLLVGSDIHCGFIFNFPTDWRHYTSFHVLTNYICIFFSEVSVEDFYPHLIELFCFILNSKHS